MELSNIEKQLIELIELGKTDEEIEIEMKLKPFEVRWILNSIIKKELI